MSFVGCEGLLANIEGQARYCEGHSPIYTDLLQQLPDHLDLQLLASCWGDRVFHGQYEQPLLLLAALRFSALSQSGSHPLYRALVEAVPGEIDGPGLKQALEDPLVWESVTHRLVQTNESSRSVAWLLPLHQLGWARRPMALVDIGCSAGLNLVADKLPFLWTDPAGEPLPLRRPDHITKRIGLDRHPLDAREAGNARWLQACIWPGQQHRLDRLEAGLKALEDTPIQLITGGIEQVTPVLQGLESELVVAIQTVVRAYLTPNEGENHRQAMNQWLESRPPETALWVQLESDPDNPDHAAILASWRGPDGLVDEARLATTDYHPTWVKLAPAPGRSSSTNRGL